MKKTIFTVLLLALTAPAMVLAQQVTDVDLSTLVREFGNNQLRANQLYGNKTIRVTGYAITITNDGIELGVRNNIAADSIFVYFNSSERSKVANLNRGDRIMVTGVFDGQYGSIKRAIIVPSPPPSQPQTRQQSGPTTAGDFYERGRNYYRSGNHDQAIADFTQAIKLNPNIAEAYFDRGQVYYVKGDNDRAIADYTQTIKIRLVRNNADFLADAYYARGLVYMQKDDYDRAIADFTQAIRLDPNDFSAYGRRGHAYYGKRDYDRAIADYTQAIRLNPNIADEYNGRGDAYYGKRDYDRAIADYEAALRIYPNHANARRGIENARRARGR